MPELNFRSTDAADPTGASGLVQQPYYATTVPGYNYGGMNNPTADGFMEFGTGTPGSLPFKVDQSGNVTCASVSPVVPIGGVLDWVNVTDNPYDADPTGTTDSTAAIQAAVTALIALGGGVLYFPRGTYLQNSEVTWNSANPVMIMGDGPGASVILLNTQTPASQTYWLIESSARVGCWNMSFNNNVNATAYADPNVAIQLTSVTWASFKNCSMQTAAATHRVNTCIAASNCTNIDIDTCDLRSYVNCVAVSGTTAVVTIRGGSFGQNSGSGVSTAATVYMTGDPQTLHVTNQVFNGGDRGLLLSGGSGANPAFVWMYDAELNNMQVNGVELDTGAECYLDSCWIATNATGTASAVAVGASFEGDAYFSQCVFQGAPGHTVSLAGGSGYVFDHCVFGDSSAGKTTSNTYDMINIASGVTYVSVDGCHMNTDPYYGVGTTAPRSAVYAAAGATNLVTTGNLSLADSSYGTRALVDLTGANAVQAVNKPYPGQMLAYHQYAPSMETQFQTQYNYPVLMDATNLTLSFSVPPSGAFYVDVTMDWGMVPLAGLPGDADMFMLVVLHGTNAGTALCAPQSWGGTGNLNTSYGGRDTHRYFCTGQTVGPIQIDLAVGASNTTDFTGFWWCQAWQNNTVINTNPVGPALIQAFAA